MRTNLGTYENRCDPNLTEINSWKIKLPTPNQFRSSYILPYISLLFVNNYLNAHSKPNAPIVIAFVFIYLYGYT